ncbi:MAG: hypothetical protein R6X02_33510 [Enhygromyxa sp.]
MRCLGIIARASVFACSFACSLGCIGTRASEQECGELGDKFVELYMAELSEEAQKLPPEVLESAAQNGRHEVVAQCKTKRTPKATIKRCLTAETMDEFQAC